jgi:branched-chain amino acid transport system permease protein
MMNMFSLQLFVAAVASGSIYALVAVGLNLIYGTMRLLNVAHGDFVMVGAYATYWALSLLGISPLLSIPAVGIAGAAVGASVYEGLFKHLLGSGGRSERIEANSLLVFFGISIVLENLTSLAFGGSARAYQFADRVLEWGDISIVENRLLALGIAVTACIGLMAFFRFSSIGLAVRAIIQSRDAAQLVGIDVNRVNRVSSALGFGFAALAGSLVSLYSQIWPFMGFSYTIIGFVIIILGGLGNIFGSLIGAMLLGVLETIGVAGLGSSYRSLLVYGFFIAIMLWRPQGLLGIPRTAR